MKENQAENQEENSTAYINEEKVNLIQDKKDDEEKKSKKSLINILNNIEKDLILKNKCKVEFDLEKNNYNEVFEKTEIFGNPVCFICSSNKMINSSNKLFFCSHCQKLFCKKCLKIHYESHYNNIEDSYLKYKNENNEINELADKVITKDIDNFNCCKQMLLIFLIPLLNIIYLIPIYSLKLINSTLETVILNCIKEALTDKVEEPNSLFNFYELFFNQSNILAFNLDLFMIMNWLGDRFLQSAGFIITSIIFFIINCIFFILLYNFDFLDYNENNKYTIWKFLHLVSLYIVLFIGLGSSTLLSQRINVELFVKIMEFDEEMKSEKLNDENVDNNKEQITELLNLNNDKDSDKNNERISIKKTLKFKEELKNNKLFKTFIYIAIFTLFSFFFDYFNNSTIKHYRDEKDEKIRNETFIKYKEIYSDEIYNNTNTSKSINDTIYHEIYEDSKIFFLYTYLPYYSLGIIISIIFYLLIIFKLLKKDNNKKNKNEKIEKSENNENIGKTENNENIDKTENKNANFQKTDNKNEIDNDNNNNSLINDKKEYTLCNICGFFYFSEHIDLRKEDLSCCKKFGICLSEFFCLNFITLLDCCNITLCYIINLICCKGKDICKCCCRYDQKKYNKISEDFCFCYKQKRKYRWLHDYLTSNIHKEIFPYILEYIFLGLTVIGLDKNLVEYKYRIKLTPQNYENYFDFSSDKLLDVLDKSKFFFIIIFTLIIFFKFSSKFGKEKPNERVNEEDYSYSILKGIHIILFINSIISLIFSSIYFTGIKNFDDYIAIPILIYKCFDLILNYYCTCLCQLSIDDDAIFSGSILVAIYISIWNLIYYLIQIMVENDVILFIIQSVISIIIIIFYIFFMFTDSKIKYIICESFVNNTCCMCKSYCGCNAYCIDGYQICSCCCCDKDSCCHCASCESLNICDCLTNFAFEGYDRKVIELYVALGH